MWAEQRQMQSEVHTAYPAVELLIRGENDLRNYNGWLDDLSALNNLCNKQTDGGMLLLYVPAFASIWTRMDERVGHYRRYTRRELAAKLIDAGYKVNTAFYCDCIG